MYVTQRYFSATPGALETVGCDQDFSNAVELHQITCHSWMIPFDARLLYSSSEQFGLDWPGGLGDALRIMIVCVCRLHSSALLVEKKHESKISLTNSLPIY